MTCKFTCEHQHPSLKIYSHVSLSLLHAKISQRNSQLLDLGIFRLATITKRDYLKHFHNSKLANHLKMKAKKKTFCRTDFLSPLNYKIATNHLCGVGILTLSAKFSLGNKMQSNKPSTNAIKLCTQKTNLEVFQTSVIEMSTQNVQTVWKTSECFFFINVIFNDANDLNFSKKKSFSFEIFVATKQILLSFEEANYTYAAYEASDNYGVVN